MEQSLCPLSSYQSGPQVRLEKIALDSFSSQVCSVINGRSWIEAALAVVAVAGLVFVALGFFTINLTLILVGGATVVTSLVALNLVQQVRLKMDYIELYNSCVGLCNKIATALTNFRESNVELTKVQGELAKLNKQEQDIQKKISVASELVAAHLTECAQVSETASELLEKLPEAKQGLAGCLTRFQYYQQALQQFTKDQSEQNRLVQGIKGKVTKMEGLKSRLAQLPDKLAALEAKGRTSQEGLKEAERELAEHQRLLGESCEQLKQFGELSAEFLQRLEPGQQRKIQHAISIQNELLATSI